VYDEQHTLCLLDMMSTGISGSQYNHPALTAQTNQTISNSQHAQYQLFHLLVQAEVGMIRQTAQL